MKPLSLLLMLCALFGRALLFAADAAPASYLHYQFRLVGALGDPFARELSVVMTRPDGVAKPLPAFYRGDGVFEARAFPHQSGPYDFGLVSEQGHPQTVAPITATRVLATSRPDLVIRIDPAQPRRFIRDGQAYFPVGANLPWPVGPTTGYYPEALRQFAAEGLNWARVWMAHWSGLNLDWRNQPKGESVVQVPLGELDLEAANRWDEIIEAAEAQGVALQMVFQHHGQVSTQVNPNWDLHPWNVRQGGFLERPEEFFTHPRARELTRQKYRYIVARWGYSPAIMAWELFNEVHFSAALRQDPPAEQAVADWHAEMAAHIRSLDTEGHLITTSHETLASPVYAKMDYYQPHLYAAEMNVAALTVPYFDGVPSRPAFFGEIGDDQLKVTPADRDSGESLLTPIWTSLMGGTEQMGQTWYVERLIAAGRLGELGSVARFVKEGQISKRTLHPFDPSITTVETAPLDLPGTLWWTHAPVVEVEARLDGRVDRRQAFLPKNVLRAGRGFPDRARVSFSATEATDVTVTVGAVGALGAKMVVQVDGDTVAEKSWPAGDGETQGGEWTFTLAKGTRRLEVISAGEDWFYLDRLRFHAPASVLSAVGKRDERFAMVFIWHRLRVSGQDAPRAVAGTLSLPDVTAGHWRAKWWDTRQGGVSAIVDLQHPGGTLQLVTPPIDRHAALLLERID